MSEADCLLADVYAFFQQGVFYDESKHKVIF